MKRLAGLLALAPCLLAQDFSQIRLEKVAAGLRFTEGPAWSREGYLLFSDVPNNQILKWVPGQRTAVFREILRGQRQCLRFARQALHVRKHVPPRHPHR